MISLPGFGSAGTMNTRNSFLEKIKSRPTSLPPAAASRTANEGATRFQVVAIKGAFPAIAARLMLIVSPLKHAARARE